ncbi:Transcriptional regulator, ArsR family [Pseudomonas aeruginosa PA99]|uniref:ArsR/SmtB family transcription factor n=1 Tax=Pseudomonas aeruginosa TaxID=287 RepID=UPI000447836F|nr:metalloregulator ArsR/SmtB family transcription factor [Pseudomonas aeruginosa]EYT98429.1 Transcriptional regulator, ArsR family [Pseudomonas aeruginosa PA99]
MNAGTSLARIAALIGDPARALMLAALMDGRSRTAGELAQAAGITPQTASAHLAKLVDAHLLAIEKQGRHRYHRLGGSEVAHALEALMVVSATPLKTPRLGPADAALRQARTCYDHMAGEIAVGLVERWIGRGWIADETSEWRLTASGRRGFAALGIPLPDESLRRPSLRPCLDWSERRPHLGGQLGATLLESLLARDWVRKRRGSRALLLTDEGARMLTRWRQR